MQAFRRLIDAIEAEGLAALVTLARVEGSSPREAGARMVVRPSGGFHGTIGGGALEWAALDAANAALKAGRGPASRRSLALGPELAQCCGGRVEWRVETFDARDLDDLSPLAIAEAGGAATIRARLQAGRSGRTGADNKPGRGEASAAPLRRRRLDRAYRNERRACLSVRRGPRRARARACARAAAVRGSLDRFPARGFSGARAGERGADPCAEPVEELARAPDGALIVVMTHSHALDLEIVAAALNAERFGFVGLIGSPTKRARFLSQMRAAGLSQSCLARLVCPIGVQGRRGQGARGDRRLDRRAAPDRKREAAGGAARRGRRAQGSREGVTKPGEGNNK